MMTKEEMKKKLKEDPFWEPNPDAPDAVWDLFDEVSREMADDDDDDDEEEEETSKKKSDDDDDEDDDDFDDYDFDDDDEDW